MEGDTFASENSGSEMSMNSDSTTGDVQLKLLRELKKETIGETYKHVNKLIKQNYFQNQENLNILIATNSSLPFFEESLRLIIIDGLQLKDEIVKILVSENDYQIKRALYCKWFFRDLLPADFYINNIFPYASASARFKILNKLSKHMNNEKEAEKIVQYLYDTWSCRLAEILLPKCGTKFILNYINKVMSRFDVSSKSRIMYNIIRRCPEAAEPLLSEFLKSGHGHKLYLLKNFFVYIASHHPNVYIDILEKHHSKLRHHYTIFGRKLSQHLGVKLKETIFKSKDLFQSHFLNPKVLPLVFEQEDQIRFIVASVKYHGDTLSFHSWRYCDNILHTLKAVKPSNRTTVLATAFKQVFNEEFNDHPEVWTSDVLELIPLNHRLFYIEKLEKFLKEKSNNEYSHFNIEENPEAFVYLYDFSVAFEKLKKIISKEANIHKRQNILKYMVENCAINNDTKSLETVIDYFGTRHRNEQSTVITSFIDAVLDSFQKSQLSTDSLQKLEELVYFSRLKGNFSWNSRYYGSFGELTILRKLDKNMNVDSDLNNYFHLAVIEPGYSHHFLENYKSKHFRFLFLHFSKKILEWIQEKKIEGEYNISEALFRSILMTWEKYNKVNKKNPILLSELPEMKSELNARLVKTHGVVGAEEWGLDVWQFYYSDVFNANFRSRCLFYMLKRKPHIILKNLKNIIENLITNFNEEAIRFVKSSKKIFSFYQVTDFVKTTCLAEFTNEKSPSKKGAITFYSLISSPEEFENAIPNYFPKEELIDKTADSKFVEIQLKIPKLFLNLQPAAKYLKLILKFFLGDFLKDILPSFRIACNSIRREKVVPFLQNYLNQIPSRISYKKEVIKLIAELSNRREKLDFCLSCWDANPHYSLRTILFGFVLENFLELPTRAGFEALEKLILESDELVIKSKPPPDQIPDEYLNDYIHALWKFSERQSEKFKNSFRDSVLNSLKHRHIKLLTKEFCDTIITENLFKKQPELNVIDFTIKYVTSEPAAVESKLIIVMGLANNSLSQISSISGFLQSLERASLNVSEADFTSVFEIILENWPKKASKEWLYEDRLILHYYDFHQKSLKLGSSQPSDVALEFGKRLRGFFSNLNNFSEFLVIVIDSLNKFFGSLHKFEPILVIKEMLKNSTDRSLAIVGICVLPDSAVGLYQLESNQTFSDIEKIRKGYVKEVVEMIKSFNDDVVGVYFRRRFGFKEEEL